MPPNAYQSEGEDGRPNVTVGLQLLAEMRSDDEIAFVLSHEMSHHIAGTSRSRRSSRSSAR